MQSEMTRPIIDIKNRTAREVFDIMCDRFKIALSAAEPVAWVYAPDLAKGSGGFGKEKGSVLMSLDGEWINVDTPLYAAPTTPSVAVKALEWEAPTTGPDEYALVANAKIMEFRYEVRRCDGMKSTFTVTRSCDIQPFAWRDTIEGAKAAAQADYEARIRSALSAQVQDVAGTEAIAALKEAEPYVEICHSLMTQKETRANVWRVLKQVRAAIAAAPAKQEGGE